MMAVHSIWMLCVIAAILPCVSNSDIVSSPNARVNTVKNQAGCGIDQIPGIECKIQITEHMKLYFQSQLVLKKPHFVQFKIRTNNKINSTMDVFKPLHWSWTFAESSKPYPFLSWNLDYGILSFHLLDAMTIHIKDVYLNFSNSCRIMYGTPATMKMIVEAMIPLINVTESDYPTYPESYFCYYHVSQITKEFSALRYLASLYFIFPISSIGFKCSVVYWQYAEKKFNVSEETPATHLTGYHRWTEVSLFPYFLSIVILMSFPIVLFRIAAWMSGDEHIHTEIPAYELFNASIETVISDNNDDGIWLYADGNSPLGLSSLLGFHICGFHEQFPVFVSRLRRLLFVLAAPMLIYLQCAMYLQGMGVWKDRDKITIKDLVSAGAPMGFLSIFGDKKDRQKVFVPLLGGPVGAVTLYYTVGILFIALPRSFKQLIEDGIPSTRISSDSPLFYNFSQVISLSMVSVKPRHLCAGYTRASTLLKCRFYCLFTNKFWRSVLDVQTSRVALVRCESTIFTFLLRCIILPVYILLCLAEILVCIVYFGLPFCGFIVIVVKGATRAVGYLGQQSRFLRSRIIFPFVFCLFTVFAYIISLMFIKSFSFLIQVLTFSFVAVIVYPSVAFGYLFYAIVLLYYFIKLIRNFGNKYEELLTTAVELSRHLQENRNLVHINNGHLNISNANVEGVRDIWINGKQLNVSLHVLQALKNHSYTRVKRKDNVFGIPKELFNTLVRKHKPIHVQLLSLCLKVILVIAFVEITFNICDNYVTGPTSEISEVMHVIFIVAIGAVPKLVEAVVSHSNSVLAREIDERRIEDIIIEYWNQL